MEELFWPEKYLQFVCIQTAAFERFHLLCCPLVLFKTHGHAKKKLSPPGVILTCKIEINCFYIFLYHFKILGLSFGSNLKIDKSSN